MSTPWPTYSMYRLSDVPDFAPYAVLARKGSRRALFAALEETDQLGRVLFASADPERCVSEVGNVEALARLHGLLSDLGMGETARKVGVFVHARHRRTPAASANAYREAREAVIRFLDGTREARLLPMPLEPGSVERLARDLEHRRYGLARDRLRRLMRHGRTEEVDIALEGIAGHMDAARWPEATTAARGLSERLGDGHGVPEPLELTPARKRILAVDDAAVILNQLYNLLRPRFEVIPVRDYAAAIKVLSDGNVDLILLDIEMPDMDGFTLLKVIRAMERHAATPVLFLTHHADREAVLKSLALGGTDYLVKPVAPAVLLEKIGKYL